MCNMVPSLGITFKPYFTTERTEGTENPNT